MQCEYWYRSYIKKEDHGVKNTIGYIRQESGEGAGGVGGEKQACWPGREEMKQRIKLNKVYVKMPEGSLVLCVLNNSESNKQSLSLWPDDSCTVALVCLRIS